MNSNIIRHESFVERFPRYEFTPLTREDFEIGEWTESSSEYNSKSFSNDPTMMKKLTLKVPFSKEEVNESFLSFNLFYIHRKMTRCWKGVAKRQSRRQELKDELFEKLREDVKENGEKYIDEKIAEVNKEIQKVIDRLNEDYKYSNSEMMLNAFEQINNVWLKEEIYDYTKYDEEEAALRAEIKNLQNKLSEKKKERCKKVNEKLADFLEKDKDALESIDSELRKDICHKLRHESPRMAVSTRRF